MIRGGGTIGKLLMIEFKEQDYPVLDEIVAVLDKYPKFESLRLNEEPVITIPGFTIYPARRKIYHNRQEIYLTAKEYDILCLLESNKGIVLTYGQIYRAVWNEEPPGNENKIVGCHVRNLRAKLVRIVPDAGYMLRCVREVGYSLEIK